MDLMKKGFRRVKLVALQTCGVAAMDLMKKGFRQFRLIVPLAAWRRGHGPYEEGI